MKMMPQLIICVEKILSKWVGEMAGWLLGKVILFRGRYLLADGFCENIVFSLITHIHSTGSSILTMVQFNTDHGTVQY